jgi:catechol 2,3-dioxygenase-like lactoylglutathione lyase family enzyme
MPSVRYMVGDVDRSVAFYVGLLGFTLDEQFSAAFARVSRDGLELWLSGPTSSAARPMPDGRKPQAGGWNRIVLQVDDIDSTVARLRESGATFRNEVISGPGGKQTLVDDPDGNPIEIFEARA